MLSRKFPSFFRSFFRKQLCIFGQSAKKTQKRKQPLTKLPLRGIMMMIHIFERSMILKNRISIRISAALLALLMCLPLAACATGDSGSTAGTGTSASTEANSESSYVPTIEQKDYDCDFNIVTDGTLAKEYITLTEEQNSGGTLDTAVFERSVKIKDHLGVQCVLQDAGDWLAYSGNVIRTVQAGDDDYQLVYTNTYQGVTDFLTNNALYSFDDLETINLDAPYWSKTLMDEITVNDQHLLGYNDSCLSYLYLIAFNKDLQTNFQVESPYELVRNKEWTLEKMMSVASVVKRDDGNNSWGAEDTYGITGWGWQPLISLVTSSDLKIVERNADGDFVLAYDNNRDRLLDVLDTVFKMYNADYTWFWKSVPEADTVVSFTAGTSLFMFASSASLDTYRETDLRFGVLPYPMFDKAQGSYKHLNWNGLMAIPGSIRNPEMVGDVLEMMAYYTAPVKDAFYEDLLSAKIAEAPDDVEMLNIIWDTQVSDVGLFSSNSSKEMDSLVYMVPMMCESGNITYSSYFRKYSKAAQTGLDKTYKQGKFAE